MPIFPHPYYSPGESDKANFNYHESGNLGGYYPLLRRDLIEKPPYPLVKVPPRFYALNIVSEYPEIAELVYNVVHFDNSSITFEAIRSNRRIIKKYSLGSHDQEEGPYCLNLEIKIEGNANGLMDNFRCS